MRTVLIVLGTIALAALVLAAGVWVGATWTRGQWGPGRAGSSPVSCGQGTMRGSGWGMIVRGMMGWGSDGMPCAEPAPRAGSTGGSFGPGMMGCGSGTMPCGPALGGSAVPTGKTISLSEAKANVESYVERSGYKHLQVTEVMEFERNSYAIVAEKDTGIGAMELLVNMVSGAVGPEMGPNMMWNAKYGMARRGMMGPSAPSAETPVPAAEGSGMTLSPEQATEAAQRWLDTNLPGRAPGDADPFYGYYTFHFLQDGQVEGMLSVHGSTGDVWYHSWHGAFMAMDEGTES